MPPETAPQAVDAFMAFLILGLVFATLFIMGVVRLLGWVSDRLGWSSDLSASPVQGPVQRSGQRDHEPVPLSRYSGRQRGAGVGARPQVDSPPPVSTSDYPIPLDTRTASVQGAGHPDRLLDTAPAVLRTAAWLELVNEQPDKLPHLVLVGGSGTGKTTLATALLATRAGEVLIITPKPDDHWGGLPIVTIDDDATFTTAAAVFSQLLAEVKRRLVAAKRRQAPGLWLTVVLDDYPALRTACPDADEAFLLVAQLGRSLRVRLIVLSYSGLVKELGLEGRGESRNHFVWVHLDRQRRATLDWDGQTLMLDTTAVPSLAQRPLPATRWWSPLQSAPLPPTTPSERREPALGSVTPTTTTTPAQAPEGPATDEVVVVGVPHGKVSVAEQVSIIRAALEVRHETGKINRSEVCRRIFEGATGGAAYTKVQVVLDAAKL